MAVGYQDLFADYLKKRNLYLNGLSTQDQQQTSSIENKNIETNSNAGFDKNELPSLSTWGKNAVAGRYQTQSTVDNVISKSRTDYLGREQSSYNNNFANSDPNSMSWTTSNFNPFSRFKSKQAGY